MIPLLVGMMLLTGVCNTLLTKYQASLSPIPVPVSPIHSHLLTLAWHRTVGYAMRRRLQHLASQNF